MNRSRFAERHPYWFTAILLVVVILVYLLAGTAAHFLNLTTMGLYGLANFALTIIVASMLTVMGWWRTVGFRSALRKSDIVYFLIPFIPVLTNLIPGIAVTSFSYVLEVFVIMLMVGFVEESIFRGLMLNALKARGLWKAAIITTLLFGLTHALNSLTGKSAVENVLQIFFALSVGFAFAALVLHKGILWPLVLAHWLINFVGFIQKPGFTGQVLSMLMVAIPSAILIAYGVFMMLQKVQEKEGQTAVSAI